MLAMILTSPPHSLQVVISISNTRFNRCARKAGVTLPAWIGLPEAAAFCPYDRQPTADWPDKELEIMDGGDKAAILADQAQEVMGFFAADQ